MKNRALLGLRHFMIPLPGWLWKAVVAREAGQDRLLPQEHHRVRDFVVREMHRDEPLSPAYIGQKLNLPVERVTAILDELEKGMVYLYRQDREIVDWAYPVTADRTPHHLTYSTGEQGNAAWAIDTIATPFVQGHLRQEPLSFVADTECGHCGQPLRIEMDADLNFHVEQQGADPLVFIPAVNFDKLAAPNIIDDFWRKSVFFWSEEHAREHRRNEGGPTGLYLTLEQSAYLTPIAQGAIFAFSSRDV
jgi:hypothetical protein